ncbi:MAG: GIY-YIG nuclease family protein [Anaerolineae bacterium]|nr:GIY-YIG nuclease family protein [Anaerolineae bacterium]
MVIHSSLQYAAHGRYDHYLIRHYLGDEYYVGQSVNVVRRYAEHRRNYSDIESISFKRLDKLDLDYEERRITQVVGMDFPLRGIALVPFIYNETDFDLIMSPDEQDKWLNDLAYIDLAGSRPINPDLRRRQHEKYRTFRQKPYAQTVIKVLREYVRTCIPAIKRGEIDFWMCACLPGEKNLYVRINAGWQTVFDVYVNPYSGKPNFQWYITKSLVEEASQVSLADLGDGGILTVGLADESLEVEVYPCPLVKGGQDQINLVVEGSANAIKLINEEWLRLLVRFFNLNLMKKGPCPWGKSHCLDLADHFME